MPNSPSIDGAVAPRPLSNRAREWVFKLYFAHLFNGRHPAALVAEARAAFVLSDEAWERLHDISPYVEDPRRGRVPFAVWQRIAPEVREALEGVVTHREALEATLAEASPRWRVERMPRVDRALLSVGAWELIWRRANPFRRVINRTVELAKTYGEAETRRFVNGILDQIRRDHGR